jgi:carboxypeptidase Taq
MLPQSSESRLKELKDIDRRLTRIAHIKALLEWDQETSLPPSGVEERAEQLAVLEGLLHELRTLPLLGPLTAELAEATLPSAEDRALVQRHQREYLRSSKLTKDFVERRARLIGVAQPAWAQARREADFSQFLPYLEKIVELERETADRVGYATHPYDALLDVYEPLTSTQDVKEIFTELEKGVVELVQKIRSRPQVDSAFLYRRYPREMQEATVRELLPKLGFDLKAGRLDTTTHPFCTTLGFKDVRITTRWDEKFFNPAFFGVIHETGHALYEQGFDPKLAESSLATGTSLGIHESQSRFWENIVGRSRAFVDYVFPLLRRHFPEALANVESEAFFRGINRVEPTFIRVEADEVTYSLHILLRFRLETALLDGSLAPSDVPGAWNDLSEKLLGIRPTNDAEGCLQDIHWAMGGLGYFPTYALGNLYSAQFAQSLRRDVPEFETLVRTGDFAPILGWLREKIHRHGAVYPAQELCLRATGSPLSPQPYLAYLRTKFGGIYGF